VRLSLRARLLVIPAVVVIFAVTLLTVLESRSQRAWIIQRETSGLTRLVHEAALAATAELGNWQPAVDSLDARHGVRATVIAADGTVLADSRAVADSMENHGGRAEVRAALAGGVGVATRRSSTVGVEFLYVAVPMRREVRCCIKVPADDGVGERPYCFNIAAKPARRGKRICRAIGGELQQPAPIR